MRIHRRSHLTMISVLKYSSMMFHSQSLSSLPFIIFCQFNTAPDLTGVRRSKDISTDGSCNIFVLNRFGKIVLILCAPVSMPIPMKGGMRFEMMNAKSTLRTNESCMCRLMARAASTDQSNL